MKKLLVVLFLATLFVLNWAAMHDIVSGESDIYLEYTFVLISILALPLWIKSNGSI